MRQVFMEDKKDESVPEPRPDELTEEEKTELRSADEEARLLFRKMLDSKGEGETK